jgi:hypothetical protein
MCPVILFHKSGMSSHHGNKKEMSDILHALWPADLELIRKEKNPIFFVSASLVVTKLKKYFASCWLTYYFVAMKHFIQNV